MKNVMMLALVLALVVTGGAAEKPKSLQIEGSTTVGPIGDAFSEAFEEMYPGLAITVKKTGSGDGAKALVEGRCDIAMMSRFMKAKEFKSAVEREVFPVAHVVAIDGVCVVVHPTNPVRELTREQVRDIYTGKVSNWSQVGGPNMDIVAISRDTSSGTYEVFNEKVMAEERMGGSVEYVNSNPHAHARVKTTPGAVAYVGFGFVDRDVRALTLDGVKPTRESIAKGAYPVSRPLYIFTNGYPEMGSLVYEFCTFHLTERGQEIVESKGYVPVTNY